MPIQATMDTLVGAILLFLALSIAFADVIQFATTNAKANTGGVVAVAGTAERTTLAYLARQSGPGLDPDRLLGLATVSGATKLPYQSYLSQTGLQKMGLYLDVMPPITVDAVVTMTPDLVHSIASISLTMQITRTFSTDPLAANVRVYVFNGTAGSVVNVLQGQASLDGKMYFTYALPYTTTQQLSNSLILIFANAGAATGYNATLVTGQPITGKDTSGNDANGPLYVQRPENSASEAFQGISPYPIYVFAYEDWTKYTQPDAPLEVGGYSLPVLLVYSWINNDVSQWSAAPYPRLPLGYGSKPSANTATSQLIVNTNVDNKIFIMRITAWVTG